MKSALTLEKLKNYCKDHGIATPSLATKPAFEAAIFRAVKHKMKVDPDPEIGCFGYHDRTDGNCITCKFQEECGEATFGISLKDYNKSIKRLENPKLSFESVRKPRSVKKAPEKKRKQP